MERMRHLLVDKRPDIRVAQRRFCETVIGACDATWKATRVATSRNRLTGISKLALGSLDAGDMSARARAAAMNIRSFILFALTAIVPSATPGKMYELLVWSTVNIFPSRTSGGNCVPLPII